MHGNKMQTALDLFTMNAVTTDVQWVTAIGIGRYWRLGG